MSQTMTVNTDSVRLGSAVAAKAGYPADSVRFDWIMALLGTSLAAGAYLDGWAHNNGKVDESFFTPWHAVLYSAMLAVGVVLLIALGRNMARGYAWHRALPVGYGLSLVGVGIFFMGGVGDMLWHEILGIEEDFEALYSPSHLLLGVGAMLILSGTFRATWQRVNTDAMSSLRDQLPTLLSLTATLSILTFFTQDLHWTLAYPGAGMRPSLGSEFYFVQISGFGGILLQTALMMGIVLIAVRRWQLAPGALTVIIGLNAIGMGFQDDIYRLDLVLAAILAGILADILIYRLKPGMQRVGELRVFALTVPVTFYLLHFLTLTLTEGLWWSVHLWTGAVFLAGIVGFLLSFLLAPPAIPSEVEPVAQ